MSSERDKRRIEALKAYKIRATKLVAREKRIESLQKRTVTVQNEMKLLRQEIDETMAEVAAKKATLLTALCDKDGTFHLLHTYATNNFDAATFIVDLRAPKNACYSVPLTEYAGHLHGEASLHVLNYRLKSTRVPAEDTMEYIRKLHTDNLTLTSDNKYDNNDMTYFSSVAYGGPGGVQIIKPFKSLTWSDWEEQVQQSMFEDVAWEDVDGDGGGSYINMRREYHLLVIRLPAMNLEEQSELGVRGLCGMPN